MSKCDIEAKDLGLGENERAVIDEQINKARELMGEKKTAAESIKTIKETLTNLKAEKEESLESFAKEKASVDEKINKVKDSVKSIKESKALLKEKAKSKLGPVEEKLNKLRESIKSSVDDKKNYNESIKKYKVKLGEKLEQIEKLEQSGDPIKDASKYESLKDDISSIYEKIKQKDSINEKFKKKIESAKIKIEQLKKDVIKIKSDRKSEEEELNKVKQNFSDDLNELKKIADGIGEAKKEADKGFKDSVKNIMSDLKDIRDYRKTVQEIARKSKNRIIDKILNDDLKGARSSIITQKLMNGELDIDKMLKQSEHPDNIYSTAEFYQRRITAGVKPYVDSVRNLNKENSIGSQELDSLIAKIKNNILNEAKELDIESEFSPNEKGYHPVSFSQGILAKMFYGKTSFKKGVSKIAEFQGDCLNAIGNEELQRMISQSYEDYYKHSTREITVPTIENAFKEFERQVLAGEKRILSFSHVRFLNDDVASKFIRKYSGLSVAGNYSSYARKAASKLSSYKIFGRGFVDDNLINNRLITKTDAQRDYLKKFRDAFYGIDYMHPAKLQLRLEELSKTQRIVSLSHGITLGLSPFGDEMIGATLAALKQTQAGGFHSIAREMAVLFGKSLKSTLTGGAFKHAFNKNYLNETDEFFRTWQTHSQFRYSYALGNENGHGLSSLMMNYFENVDNGLRVSVNKSYVNFIKENSKYDLEQLSKENESLYNLMTETHGIDSSEWDKLRQHVKDNTYLDAAKFQDNPDFMRKIVSMEYQASLSAIPNKVVSSPHYLQQLTHSHPILSRTFGMFWSFFGKSMVYSWHEAQKYAPLTNRLSKFAYFLGLQTVGGYIPNYTLNIALGLAAGRRFEDIAKDKETYISAALGPIGRIYSIGAALSFNQSDAGYAILSSPLYTAASQVLTASYKTAQSVNDPKINPYFYWVKAVSNAVPFSKGTPAQAIALHKLNKKYGPRKGEKFQEWIQKS